MISYRELVSGLMEGDSGGLESVVVVAEIDSTNTLARHFGNELLGQGLPVRPTLLVAHAQTAGRGRRGNAWSSPPGGGIYASLLAPIENADQVLTLPLLAGVALAKGLNRHLDLTPCRLKWPNDLLAGGRKIGGLLIELLAPGEAPGGAIVGFGINVEQAADELPVATATSVRLAASAAPPLPELALALAASLLDELTHLGGAAYALREMEALSAHRAGDLLRCRVGEETVEGTFAGFDARGFLRLEGSYGERLLSAGEVLDL